MKRHRPENRLIPTLVLLHATWLASTSPLVAQDHERWTGPPIAYEEPATEGPVERLVAELEAVERTLAWEPRRGWLPSLLEALDVPVSSQTLVFSRTSFQQARIGPRRPRAVYFGDDVYVGWVPGAPVLEITSMDPRRGAVFYVLDQSRSAPPRPERRVGECLQCHASPMTRDWPGNLVRSVHPDPEGFPNFAAGTTLVDQATPFERRWGGWYVTGEGEGLRHLGNAVLAEGQSALEPRPQADVLAERVNLGVYPGEHSDLVALLALEHQAEMHNRLARAAYEVRAALERERVHDDALGGDPRALRASTQRVIGRQVKAVLDHLLFHDEEPLPGPIRGSSTFASDFAAAGPRDAAGRSLRDLDLKTRLLRLPCSWVVYSPAFDALPEPLLSHLCARLDEVLRGAPAFDEYVRLSLPNRRAIREILVETKPMLAERWGD